MSHDLFKYTAVHTEIYLPEAVTVGSDFQRNSTPLRMLRSIDNMKNTGPLTELQRKRLIAKYMDYDVLNDLKRKAGVTLILAMV